MARKMTQQNDGLTHFDPEAEKAAVFEPKQKPLVGRAKIKVSPVKEWSGGMSADEAQVWENIADKVRTGIPPRIAAGALNLGTAYDKFRRSGHPVVKMLLSAWDEGCERNLSKIQEAQSWQAAAWIMERTRPMEFAVDSAIRGQLNELAQEAGFTSADLLDAVRMIQDAKESGVDLAEVLRQAKVDLHGQEPVEGDQSPFQAP